jgi:hypothetical protein
MGADTVAWLSMAPRAKLAGGEFYFDREVRALCRALCALHLSPLSPAELCVPST